MPKVARDPAPKIVHGTMMDAMYGPPGAPVHGTMTDAMYGPPSAPDLGLPKPSIENNPMLRDSVSTEAKPKPRVATTPEPKFVNLESARGALDVSEPAAPKLSAEEKKTAGALKDALAAVPDFEAKSVFTQTPQDTKHFKYEDGQLFSASGQPMLSVVLSRTRPGPGASGSTRLALVNPSDNTWMLMSAHGMAGTANYTLPRQLPEGVRFDGAFDTKKVVALQEVVNGAT